MYPLEEREKPKDAHKAEPPSGIWFKFLFGLMLSVGAATFTYLLLHPMWN